MSFEFDYLPLTELPVQRAFLHELVPCLASVEEIEAIWLAGSLARGDADRWSSVDLYLLWRVEGTESAGATSPSNTLKATLDEALGEGNVILDQLAESDHGDRLRGISLDANDTGDPSSGIGTGGVLFELFWTLMADKESLGESVGPLHPLYFSTGLANENSKVLESKSAAFESPDSKLTDMQLQRFWLLLARMPAVVSRREQLAAHALLTEMRTLLIDMVVALNGARRPQTRARVNQFLGQAQREAFERSLGNSQSARGTGTGSGFNWIGQAVALVVLYRWYAPQLAARHSLPYPKHAEETVLTLLSKELENWPSHISTG